MGQSQSANNDAAPAQNSAIPQTMRALRLARFVPNANAGREELNPCFEVAQVPTPEPRDGEVLVKIECSPINPSDLSTLKGTYNSKQREELPCLLGFEASGTVVKSGGGVMGWMVMGKRVGIVSTKGGRMWAEYAVVPAMQCVQLPDDVSFEDGCSCFVNPLTALSFIEIAQANGNRAMLHTAAASALGKMLLRLCIRNNIELVCVVRRAAQAAELRALGAKHIVSTDEEDWRNKLQNICSELQCTLAFECVAGELTGSVMEAMPAKSIVYVYGGMSEQKISNIRPTDLIFAAKQLRGFWLTPYLAEKSLMSKGAMLNRVASLLSTDLKTEVRVLYPLEQAVDALLDYTGNMSAGKVCFAPSVQQRTEPKQKQQQQQQAPAAVEQKEEASPAAAAPASASASTESQSANTTSDEKASVESAAAPTAAPAAEAPVENNASE